MDKDAINFVEYDEKTDTHFIRLTGESPKYTVAQRIELMAASEAMYEVLTIVLPFINDGEIKSIIREALAKANK